MAVIKKSIKKAKPAVRKQPAGPRKKPASKAGKKNLVKVKSAKKAKPSVRKTGKAVKPVKKSVRKAIKKAPSKSVKKQVRKSLPKAKVQKGKLVKKPPAASKVILAKKVLTGKPLKKLPAVKLVKEVQNKDKILNVPLKPVSKKTNHHPIKPAKGVSANKPIAKPTDVDKLQHKAEKIMKELEETMDLRAMKPRIKVPAPAPAKPKVVHVIKLPEPTQTIKEKYQLEFEFRSSKNILFSYLNDSSGLTGWFAEEVKVKDDIYTFIWEGVESRARMILLRDQYLVRFVWLDEPDGTYFQFEIREDDITSDIALIITDWALPADRESNVKIWESQVHNLRQLLGSL